MTHPSGWGHTEWVGMGAGSGGRGRFLVEVPWVVWLALLIRLCTGPRRASESLSSHPHRQLLPMDQSRYMK